MKNLLGCLFMFSCLFSFAQAQAILSGTVTDDAQTPITFGDVLLLSTDSLPIKFTYIEEGQFQFDPVPSATYQLVINCLGYESYTQPITLQENQALTIQLSNSIAELETVTVTGQKKTIVYKNGNITVNVANSLLATQPTPLEVLSQLPTLQISPNQTSISVIGKGNPLIYLDQQRIDLAQLLTLSVEEIETIEIINHPPAKYEAEGRAVVLVTRKKNLREGYKVNLSEVISAKRRWNNYATLNTSFKKNRLEAKTNLAYHQLTFWESMQTDFISIYALLLEKNYLLRSKLDK